MTMTASSSSPASAAAKPKILLLGDSLTQTSFEGWGATLANVYQRRADIVNRGYSGYNTKFYLKLPMEDELNSDVCLVIIFFGANDAALEEEDPHHYVSVEDYSKNLMLLVERVRDKYECNNNILLVAPPPVHHEQRLVYQKQRYGDKATGRLERTLENTGKYAAACQQVAADLGLPCLNLYEEMQKDAGSDWSRFLSDGLHFSPAGHEFVGQAVLKTINTSFEGTLKVTPDPVTGFWANSSSNCQGLKHGGPYHDEIDHRDPDKAFTDYFV